MTSALQLARFDPVGMVVIYDEILAADAASFDVTDIPQGYKHLMIEVQARGTAAGQTIRQLLMRFNNDSSAVYDYQYQEHNNAVDNSASAVDQTKARIGYVPAANAPSGLASQQQIVIANYASVIFDKTFLASAILQSGTAAADMNATHAGGIWTSAAAINRVTIYPESDNLLAGSRVTIYGLGGAPQTPELTTLAARVSHSTTQSLADATWQTLVFDTETRDDGAFHSTVSNTGRMTVPATGWYDIKGCVQFAANQTGARGLRIRLNGATTIAMTYLAQTPQASDALEIPVGDHYYLTAGDYVELQAFQASTGALNAAGGEGTTVFSIAWAGVSSA